jgi:hypothetical protein
MNGCIRDKVLTNKAVIHINIDVVFVAKVALAVLFSPLGIEILLSHFMGVILLFFWDIPLFQVLLLLFRYLLLWDRD